MIETHSKYLIIGAGLSGLTLAHELQKRQENNFLLLEARPRIGGRIHTQNNIDLGATWFQNHHTHLFRLIDDLGIEKFPQYSKGIGVLVHNPAAPAHYFQNDPNSPSAYRIAGGSMNLIEKLAINIRQQILLNTIVHSITETVQGIRVSTSEGNYIAEKVIVTLPPQLASCIQYSPSLPQSLRYVMENTHTWMGNALKVGLTFKHPFWRDKGFSGIVMGQAGPTTELYDHSNFRDEEYALMGFVNENLRSESSEDRKEHILSHLETYLGTEVRSYLTYEEKDWSHDIHTVHEKFKSVYILPKYGNPLFQKSYLNKKLFFCGAETALVHGGYMDGAIFSGQHLVKKLLTND